MTIFGHNHFDQKLSTKFDIFLEKISKANFEAFLKMIVWRKMAVVALCPKKNY